MLAKKILIFFFLCLCLSCKLEAQSASQGYTRLKLAVGFGSMLNDKDYSTAVPPLTASLQVTPNGTLNFGICLAYATGKRSESNTAWCSQSLRYYTYTDRYYQITYILGGVGGYHFGNLLKNNKVDLYISMLIGYYTSTTKYTRLNSCSEKISDADFKDGFIWSVNAGCLYKFNETFGVFCEVGYGIAYVTVGAAFEF